MSNQPPYLQKANVEPAGNLVNGALWLDIKRCLMERGPESLLVTDTPDVAAAKAHQRQGYEKCIKEIEALPYDAPAQPDNPFQRPAVQETAD